MRQTAWTSGLLLIALIATGCGDGEGGTSSQRRVNGARDFNPSFSPDGSKIAFTSDRDGNDEIYVMNADGTEQVRLTNNQAWDWQPEFSPDGSKIAFTTDRDGNVEIYVMNTNGTNQVRLTNNGGRP